MLAASHVSPYGGSWYPADPSELGDLLDRLFAESESRTGCFLAPQPLAFVVPHAGLVYSGGVAAAAYRHIAASQPGRVILLGFSHHGSPAGAWIPDVDAIRTPLGELALDTETMRALAGTGAFQTLAEERLCDHSVEIQLPLLQRAVPAARVTPVYVGNLQEAARSTAAQALAGEIRAGALLVASSDFTHYGRSFHYQPFPAGEGVLDRLRELDESVIDAAGSLLSAVFLGRLRETSATVCGYDPIALLLETMRVLDGEDEIFQQTLDYRTSGEITGDPEHSVSYAALGYFRHGSLELGAGDREALLDSARRTLRQYQETGRRRPLPPERITPALERRAAAFVTLEKDGELRGCVGRHSTGEPLWQSVPSLALAAALDDPRFPPVAAADGELHVEISVLSPMKRIDGVEAFRVKRHGVYLDAGMHRALLLPQVAAERDWSAQQFLTALARKAGATPGIYRDPETKLYVFRAQVFG